MLLTIDKSLPRLVGATMEEFKATMNLVNSEAFMRAEGMPEAEIKRRVNLWKEVEWAESDMRPGPKVLTSWLEC